MKPKLKVGDIVKIVSNKSGHYFKKGEVVMIREIVRGLYTCNSNKIVSWAVLKSDLVKCNVKLSFRLFEILPDISELEQHRLSLEVVRNLMLEFIGSCWSVNYKTTSEWLRDRNWAESTYKNLTEILEP